uniref:ATP-dependent DNA helicase n=1 Tax=Percolomonas cosmopolitus TaxID=63605 RepID=A0A7S1KP68_9EUKA|mmetsp:Transcript_3053/g.11752  ORF Transcript_3053/g.11752 Transcript_3053/m.11752 type:complete len:790 (+) Transcript_3053:293-2662(+)
MKRRRSYFLQPKGSTNDSGVPPEKRLKMDENAANEAMPSSSLNSAMSDQSSNSFISSSPAATKHHKITTATNDASSRFFSTKNSSLVDSFPSRARNENNVLTSTDGGPVVDGKGANRTIVGSLKDKMPRKRLVFGNRGHPATPSGAQNSSSVNTESLPLRSTHASQAKTLILPVASTPKPNKNRLVPLAKKAKNVMHPPAVDPPQQNRLPAKSVAQHSNTTTSTVKTDNQRVVKKTTTASNFNSSSTVSMKQTTLSFQNKRLLNSTSDLSPMKNAKRLSATSRSSLNNSNNSNIEMARPTFSSGRETLLERIQNMGTRQVTNANNIQRNNSSRINKVRSIQPSKSPDLPFNTGRFNYKDRLDYQRLSTEQKFILDEVISNSGSVFFTGAAGCGKSHLLRTMVAFLKEMHGDDRVFVTASTGIAGCNIEGTTVHSFAGIGIGNGTAEQLAKQVASRKAPKNRWKMARVLVIDEISMLEADLLDKLDHVARHVRGKRSKFFGGIQLILVGDFFQLPPVSKGEPKFCFEANCWQHLSNTFVLTQVFRQKNPEFVKILNEMRVGELSKHGEAALRACINRRFDSSDGIEATQLFPLKRNVERENLNRLAQLSSNAIVFEARDRGSSNLMTFLDKNCQAPAKLTLKKNAQVVLLKNLDFERNLVNGSRGVIVGFHDSTGNPMVRFEGQAPMEIASHEFSVEMGRDKAIREQIPLNLAFSMSIHKAQGMTLNRVSTSLREVFAPGQAYVSVSRVTSLEGLCLTTFDPSRIHAHPKVLKFYKELLQQNQMKRGRRG